MAAPPGVLPATSGDLRTARVAVRDALLTIGCYPVEQTTFGPDYRTVQNMLGEKIRDCQALVHLAGLRYGAEPDPASVPPGTPRRSYTQLEYDLGRTLVTKRGDGRFRVYTFVCPETFPYDAEPDTESAEQRMLQEAHRRSLQAGDPIYETPATLDALAARVLALKEDVFKLRAEHDRLRRMTLGAAAAILLLLIGIGWGVRAISSGTKTIQDTQAVQFSS
jgi:hypothetical protein